MFLCLWCVYVSYVFIFSVRSLKGSKRLHSVPLSINLHCLISQRHFFSPFKEFVQFWTFRSCQTLTCHKTCLPGYIWKHSCPPNVCEHCCPVMYSATPQSGERSASHLHAQSSGIQPTASMNPATTVKIRNSYHYHLFLWKIVWLVWLQADFKYIISQVKKTIFPTTILPSWNCSKAPIDIVRPFRFMWFHLQWCWT